MNVLDKVKKEIAAIISENLKVRVDPSFFIIPPQTHLGDLSLPFFAIAKNSKFVIKNNDISNIANIGAEAVIDFLLKSKWVKHVKVVGPYLNIFFREEIISEIVNQINHEKGKYGRNKTGNSKRVMIEYSNANTHKEYHVGHLRNISYGDAVNRILSANGYKVFPVSYINDFGIHVAKTIWWLYHEKNTEAKQILKEGTPNKGYFLGQQYALSVKEIDENPEAKNEVSAVMKQIESRRGDLYKLWKKTRAWSLEQFAAIYKELGVTFATTFYENDFLSAGLKMVKNLEEKGVLKKSEGALIADLEHYNLGVLVVLRSDGTALYPVADLPLAITKIKDYKLDESLYVVDIRQGLYFQQLFKLLELLGYKTKFAHLPYDFVKLPTGMMSSRTGNIIAYEDLKNAALEKAKSEIIKRHTDWNKKQINQVASVVAFGALKFEMVKVGATKQITFDIDKALQFEGFTAAYLQYTYARIQSIVRKAPSRVKKMKIDSTVLTETKERQLAVLLAEYPLAIAKAGEMKDPAEIAKYIFTLAQSTNDYYHAVPVLKAESEKIAGSRLALVRAAAQTIKNGLELLGVQTIEEM